MTAVLTRFKLFPPGIKKTNGNWILLNANEDASYVDFLAHQAKQQITKVVIEERSQAWNLMSTPAVAEYLLLRHPNLQFIDFSEQLGLTLFTHIQVRGMSAMPYSCVSVPGSSRWFKHDARNRTISEMLERSAIVEMDLPQEGMWGSAVAPSIESSRHHAIEECVERWMTYLAFSRTDECFFLKVNIEQIEVNGVIEGVIFEWEKYEANIDVFTVCGSFTIPIVLVRVQLVVEQRKLTFYGNGLGGSFLEALTEALLETIQFIPGKSPAEWMIQLIEDQFIDSRINAWQIVPLHFEINDKISHEVVKKFSLDDDQYKTILLAIFNGLNGNVITKDFMEIPGMSISCSYLSSKMNWNNLRGIPIA